MTTDAGVKHAEILWIAQRKTYAFDPDGWGYNMTRGGDGIYGCHHTDDKKRQISLTMKGVPKTMKHVEAMRQGAVGRKMPVRTQKHLANHATSHKTTIDQMSCEERRVRFARNVKPIMQIEPMTGNVIATYASASEASRRTGIMKASECARGVRRTAGKFIWRWVQIL